MTFLFKVQQYSGALPRRALQLIKTILRLILKQTEGLNNEAKTEVIFFLKPTEPSQGPSESTHNSAKARKINGSTVIRQES